MRLPCWARTSFVVASCLIGLLVVAASQAVADPTYGVMNADGGIYWRSAPDWNTPVAIAGNGVYNGSVVAVHCYKSGTSVPGSADTMWEQATVVGGPGTGSGWLNEHFINDGQPINQPSPGVPPCDAPPPPSDPGPAPAPDPGPTAPIGDDFTFGIYNADGGIYYRSSPHWSDTPQQVGVGVYNGDQVRLICGASGDPVGPGGNTAWSYVTNLSRNVGNGWVSEHFINDGLQPNQWPSGLPQCGSDIPGATSSPGDDGGGTSVPSGSAPTTTPSSGATSGCPLFMVYDSRGSGEPYGMSPPGASFAAALQRRYAVGRVGTVANPYPAVGLGGDWRSVLNLIGAGTHIAGIGAYNGSVNDGKRWLSAHITTEIATCPQTRIVLTGYSQGAQVTGDVWQRSVSSADRSHFAAVVLFGDPYFNGGDSRADHSSYRSERNGILGKRPSFNGDRRVASYCHDHDPICQTVTTSELVQYRFRQHENYNDNATAAAKGV